MNILIVATLLVTLYLLASLLNLCIYAAKDSLSFFLISMKQLTNVCMSELQIFNQSKSLISFQLLSEPSASGISMHVRPLHLACASLVLLSFVKLVVVYILTNQSSKCEESLSLKIVIS